MSKKNSIAHKILSFVLNILLIFYSVAPGINTSLVYAQEASPTPSPTQEASPSPSVEPTPSPTDEPQVSPSPSPAVEPTISPKPSPSPLILPEASSTTTPSSVPSVEPSPTDQVQGSSTPEPTVGQPNAPPSESPNPSLTPEPSPSVEVEQTVKGHLSATILENTDAQSLQLDLSTQGDVSSASLTTDKADYAPTDTAVITGSDFPKEVELKLIITADNYRFEDKVKTDENGSFIYSYQLDGTYRPLYKVEAYDLSGALLATVTFTDSPIPSSFNLLSWKTVPSGAWINGNLGSSNSDYKEGETVPFELDLGTLATSGNPYTTSVCRDYQNGTAMGYISLQPFNTSKPAVPDGAISTTNGPFSGSNISSISFTEIGGQGGCNSGQRETQISFVVTSGSVNTYLLWGGKLASPLDAGAGNGAASYPGSSLSMQILSSAKNASINPNAIIELAQITVTKIVDSGSATADQWGFNISPNPNGETLPKYPASGQNTVTFLGLPTGSYQITETSLSGYSFASGTGTNCTFSGSTGTASVTAATTAVNATCNFHNAQQKGTVVVHKDVQGPNGEAITDTSNNFTVNLDGANSQLITDNGTVTYSDVVAGSHTVNESVIPSGYTLHSMTPDSDGGTPGAQITVTAGQTTDVYIINRQQQTKLTLVKTVINDNGGTKQVSDFVLKIDGNTVTSGVANNVSAGSHTASEINLAGYSASSWGGDCNADGTITLSLGDNKTCTIANNDIQPKLTVTKIVTNDNGGTKVVSDFPLFVDQTSVTSGVQNGFNAGTYTVSETQDAGYDATISGDCASNGSITLNAGDVKSCTITNNDKVAHLIVIKHVVNDNGGTALASAFTMTINNVTASGGNSFAGTESPGTDKTLTSVGSYNVTEVGPTGYSSSASTGCSGTIALGETKTCTITNDDNAPSLTLLKTVTNDNGGSALVTDWTLTATGALGSPTNLNGSTPVVSGANFKADTYTLAENGGPSGYSASQYSCVKNNGAPVSGNSITLGLGDVATCTINNNDIAPTLKLVKSVLNDNGGTATASAWALIASGGTDGFTDNGATGSFHTVTAGVAYALSELGPVGYTAGSWSCSGGSLSGSSITLSLNQNITCTITNNDQSGRIKIIKNTAGGNGTFGFTIDGPTPSTPDVTTANSTGDTGFIAVNAGSYSISETTLPDGWDLTGANCDSGTPDSFTVPNGGTVICTFTNTKKGHLVVQKTTLPAGDQTVFSITATGSGTITNGGAGTVTDATDKDYEVTPGTYSVAETVPTGWDKTGDTCQGVVVAAGETKTCEITNTKRGHIIIVKDSINNDAQDFTFHNNFGNDNLATFLLDDDSSGTLPDTRDFEVLPRTYSVSEDPVIGWQQESQTCTDGSPVSGIVVSPGETVTCTFVNEEFAKIILVKNTVGGDGMFDFSLIGQGLPGSTRLTTVGNTASQAFSDLDQDNTYSITETVPAGWDLTSASCTGTNTPASITPDPGETVTCTFTNTKKGSITIVKDANPDHFQDFSYTTTGSGLSGFDLDDDGDNDNELSNSRTFNNLVPGEYSVAEGVVAGWDLTDLSCDTGESIDLDNRKATITLSPGENVTCTFTNTKRGHIIVDKITDPSESDQLFNFNTVGVGYTSFSLKDMDSPNNQEVAPGDYSVSEVLPGGWNQTEATCDDESAVDNIHVSPGETVTCTFTNTQKGRIIVVKETYPARSEQSFDFESDYGDESFSLTDGESNDSELLSPGTYSVSENTPQGWDLTSSTCNDGSSIDEINLDPGETVTCTFHNTQRGRIIIEKQTNPRGSEQSFNFETNYDEGGFSLVDGRSNESGLLVPGTYSVSENATAGWITTGSCSDESPIDNISLQAGETITCTFTNTLQNPILTISKSNDKGGVDLTAGSSVLYTLVIEATQSAIQNVVVKDLLPGGFKYHAGSWTVNSSTRGNITSLITEPVYASPGTWNIGDMAKDEKIILTLTADIDGGQQPGLYKDLAWAQGTSLASTQVLANAENPGFVADNFVGTDVNIVKNPDGTAANLEREELRGEVLGASIAMPATGANSLWIILAGLLLITGAGSITAGIRLRRKNV